MNNFKFFDILSDEVHFTFNKEGDIRNKTIYGGIITLISYTLIILSGIYFLINLIKRENKSLISSTESSPYLNLTESNLIPFIFRLSDKNSIPYENAEKLYKIQLKYWYGGSNKTQLESESESEILSLKQNYIDLIVEKCDINKHFGKYKYLFESMVDLNSFYCTYPRSFNYSLYGKYGSFTPFSYYNFYFVKCNVSLDSNCYKSEEIESILSNVYMDMRTINYEINSELKDVREANIISERFMISLSVFKRIWMIYDNVKYITDKGYFLTNKKEINFFQFQSLRYDTDLRNNIENTIPGSFLYFTISFSGHTSTFIRTFNKIQDYTATLSGIIKIISLIAQFCNYFYSQNQYYFRLINGFMIPEHQISKKYENNEKNNKKEIKIDINKKNKLTTNLTRRNSFQNHRNSTIGFFDIRKMKKKRNSMNNYDLQLIINEEHNLIIKREHHERKVLNCLGYILPFYYYTETQKNKNELKFCFESINDNLNIVKVLIRLVRSERLLSVYLKNENKKNKIEKNETIKFDRLHTLYSNRKTDMKKNKTLAFKVNSKFDSCNSSTIRFENESKINIKKYLG